MRHALAMVAAAVTALAAAVLLAASPSPGTGLAGTWELNSHLSKAPKRPENSAGGRFSGGFGGDRHGGGMGGRWGSERGEGAEGGPPRGQEGDRAGGPAGQSGAGPRGGETMFSAPATIRVDLEGADVRIISADGHVRIITPDGKAVERERNFVTVTETARWDTGKLVVTSSTPKGRLITETFAIADDGSGRLVHTIAMTRAQSKDTRTATWVYDLAPEPTATAAPSH
jgi:hypothetical protein